MNNKQVGKLNIENFEIKKKLKKQILKNTEYEKRFSKIIDADNELAKVTHKKQEIETTTEKLRKEYKEKIDIFYKLIKQVAIYDQDIKLAELGFYKPHYDFDTSEDYKDEIKLIKDEQKELILYENAVTCSINWTINGSEAQGRINTKRNIKLTTRAFNNECEAAISKTRWDNAKAIEKRIEKAFNSINKFNKSNHITISEEYLTLKLKELRLTHEYKEKKQQEKKEQLDIKQQMREETRLQKEFETSLNEEKKYQKLLNKAKLDAEKSAGQKLEKLQDKINALNETLKKAQENSERAKSMAQQTKSGHVYIISNIGTLGKNVYKIGLTRRLEPFDRVRELSGASVPFVFDVHAMIYSNDAPKLENNLHKIFDSKRVNLVNTRKEFFNITLDEIKEKVLEIAPNVQFIKTAEARDYRESKAILKQKEIEESKNEEVSTFPNAI